MRARVFCTTMIGVLLLTIPACRPGRGEEEAARPTPVPAEATETPAPSGTPTLASGTPTAPPATTTPQAPLSIGERRERLGQAGLIYAPPAGYDVEYGWHKVSLRPLDADPALGPLIEIDSNPFLCGERVPVDVSAALEVALLCASWRFDALDTSVSEPITMSLGRNYGLLSEVEGTRDGVAVRMRVYVLKPSPTRVLVVIGLAPADRYAELDGTLQAVVASMDLLAWQSYTNANDVADVAFFDGYLFTATSGGVVAWPLGGGMLPVKYTVDDGLPSNAATALTVCSMMGELTLFAGTLDAGVARFDPGRRMWIPLDTPYAEWTDTRVRALACALDNRLVVGYEDEGVDLLNLDEVLWYHFSNAEGVPGGLRALATRPYSNEIWIIAENKLARVSDEGLTTIVGGDGGGIYYQGGLDGTDNLWLAAYYRLARRSAQGEWTYLDNGDIADLFATSLTALAVAGDDTLWLGSYNQVARFDPIRGQVIELHRREPGMVAGTVRALTVDPMEGWIAYAVEGAGASVLRDGYWRTFVLDDQPLQDNRIRTLAQDADGLIWYGDRSGNVVSANPSDIASVEQRYRLPRGFALSIYADADGGVWVGHFDGASHYSGRGARHLAAQAPELADLYVRAIARDTRGRLWLGSDEGLFIWDNGRVMVMTEADGLPGVEVRALQPQGEAMWVGTTAGLARVADDRISVFRSESSDLPSDSIRALTLDPWGDLLVAAGSGLVIWQEAVGDFHSLLESHGESPITSIAVADDGEIWVATARDGVYSLLYQGEAAHWHHLTGQDGIPSNGYGPHAVFVDGDGVVWLAGESGGIGRYGP